MDGDAGNSRHDLRARCDFIETIRKRVLDHSSKFTPFNSRAPSLIPQNSSELHSRVMKHGWQDVPAEGSHYIYEKNGKYYPVPYHGAKEMGKGLVFKIIKEMKLK